MADLKGIVTKPQFDTVFFEPGKAIHFEQYGSSGYLLKEADGIIYRCNPLELEVVYYDKKFKDTESVAIKILDVTKGEFKLVTLREER